VDGCRMVDIKAVGLEGAMSSTGMCGDHCYGDETGDRHEFGVVSDELVKIELSRGNQGDLKTLERRRLVRLYRSACRDGHVGLDCLQRPHPRPHQSHPRLLRQTSLAGSSGTRSHRRSESRLRHHPRSLRAHPRYVGPHHHCPPARQPQAERQW
jgi:hypothetical protein